MRKRRMRPELEPVSTPECPSEDEYIREFCPGEFGAKELPEIPPGWRYATIVTVIHRSEGIADGRYRSLITLCDDLSGAGGRRGVGAEP